jgi:hypothetical protein
MLAATKGAASEAMRKAIIEFEKTHGKITKYRDILGTVTWAYEFGDGKKIGFPDRTAAETELVKEIERRAAAEQVPAEVDPTFAEYSRYWLDKHASRTLAPKTLERYREFAGYLIRHLGKTPLNELTTAQIQRVVHDLEDHGGMVTEAHPTDRPAAGAKNGSPRGNVAVHLAGGSRSARHPENPASDAEQACEASEAAEAGTRGRRQGKAEAPL